MTKVNQNGELNLIVKTEPSISVAGSQHGVRMTTENQKLETEDQVLLDLRPSVPLTTKEQEAIAMWISNPRQYPELTEEEHKSSVDAAIFEARRQKGQALYNQAYGAKVNGERKFPTLDASSFKEIIRRRGEARSRQANWTSPFVIDNDNKSIISLLCLYFTNDERFNKQGEGFSLFKGIALVGDTGVGKTVLMQLCNKNPHVCYAQHDCKRIADEFTKEGTSVIDHYVTNTAVTNTDDFFGQQVTGRFFDDLGTESTAKHFGNERNVMGDIIEGRHQNRNFHLTHLTSNHTLDDIHEMYGKRVADRIREMCNIIEFPAEAKSRRR